MIFVALKAMEPRTIVQHFCVCVCNLNKHLNLFKNMVYGIGLYGLWLHLICIPVICHLYMFVFIDWYENTFLHVKAFYFSSKRTKLNEFGPEELHSLSLSSFAFVYVFFSAFFVFSYHRCKSLIQFLGISVFLLLNSDTW